MGRLNEERQKKLEPKRLEFSKSEIEKLGLEITFVTENRIDFIYNNEKIMFYPYSGWHTGKSIKDGRGWKNLYSQIR